MHREEGFVASLTKFYILTMLRENPRHGYEIIDDLGKRLGKKPSAGQVYPLLKKFQKAGYVTQEIMRVGRKKRKVYKLTTQGKRLSIDLLNKFSDILNTIVEQNITVCAHCKCEIYRGTYKERKKGKSLNFCCKSCAASYR